MFGNLLNVRMVCLAVMILSGYMNVFAWTEYAEKVCGALPGDTVAVVPAGTTSLPDYAFADCESLRHVQLPGSLRSIGDYAFLGCSGLESLDLPTRLTKIGEGAFRECRSLKNLEIPAGVSVIPRYMCAWDTDLVCVVLPRGLKDIGSHAFAYCGALESVGALQNGAQTGVDIPYGVAHIGSNAFSFCSSIKEATLPASITELESYAFSDCSSLERIELPANDKMLGEYMVTGCPRLRLIICRSPKRPTFDCDSPLFDPHEDMHPEYETPGWSF